jgi:hypothetical protein
MHPAAAPLLRAVLAAAEARARGRCEACGAPGPRPVSLIEGLPDADLVLVLCPACEASLMPELSGIARIDELRARAVALRR